MSNAALSVVSPAADSTAISELLVIVTVDDATATVTAEPAVLKVPYGFRGYIRWRIEHAEAQWEDTPIVFTEGPRTVPPPATPKTCHVWWENAGAGTYHYLTMVQDRFRHLKPDPTVENDPPGFVA